MGRWAQQQRRGGGPPPDGSPLIHMVLAETDFNNSIVITYSSAIAAATFNAGDHLVPADSATSTMYQQVGANQIEVFFDVDVNSGSTCNYAAIHVGVLNPDSVGII